jgi:hypothetical protein
MHIFSTPAKIEMSLLKQPSDTNSTNHPTTGALATPQLFLQLRKRQSLHSIRMDHHVAICTDSGKF